ncbi:hypothetical protein Prede_0746 [Prevotella dentalis DSM 3688]|uniref:Uncharacterized protein n=2 Tax=Prevotella dentalis (strain ATCC 49559 / DSM 3688 / JCM 13448 / NCTC 12043 / ES 2772) TaxID=908937 RepID=L0J987_PREDD|nr:hypothetical protein [Prevotella dentalis]AGB28100.1 hypothetical protein Prede_0746 [Prevotella dentalis DSM 3688]
MTNRVCFSCITLLLCTLPMAAQTQEQSPIKPFRNLDVSVSAGTTGLGLEVGSDISEMVRLRAGFSFMPHWSDDMKFGVQVGDKPESKYDAQGNRVKTKFDRLQARMKELTGFNVDETIHLQGKPKFYNFSLLVDVMPFANKQWHLTAGFYWGNNKLADAVVSQEDMTTMLAVGIYNNMYSKAINNQPFVTINGNDVYNESLANKLISYGRMKYRIGDMKSTGEACYAEPDANGLIKAEAIINNFKPYLGFGYESQLGRADNHWKIGFDAGILFWGGRPRVYTERTIEHITEDEETGIKTYNYTKEKVDIVRDVTNYRKNIKGKINFLKALPLFPVLNVKLTKSF